MQRETVKEFIGAHSVRASTWPDV